MILSAIYSHARATPRKTAYISNGTPISYETFAYDIDAARRYFIGRSLPSQGVAIVQIHQLYGAWVVVLALRSLGLTTIAVSSLEQAEALRIHGAVCYVVLARENATVSLSGTRYADATALLAPPSIFDAGSRLGLPDAPSADAPWGGHILFTSGTTGEYKKVLMDGSTDAYRDAFRVRDLTMDQNTVIHTLNFGLWTAAGYKAQTPVWRDGGTVITDQRQTAFEHFFDYPPTVAVTIPAYATALLEAKKKLNPTGWPRPELDLLIGGTFVPLSLAFRLIEELTPRLRITFGSTETVGGTFGSWFTSEEDLFWLEAETGREFQIVDEDDQELGLGEQGYLRIRLIEGDCQSYLDDAEASARFFRGGYFYPGDLAMKRADGRIRPLGRAGDVISLGLGHKVATAPLEHEIQRKLDIAAACIFSELTDSGSHEAVVALECMPIVDQEVLHEIAGMIQGFDQIRFHFVPVFPRTQAGMAKVNRRVLRTLVTGDHGELIIDR